MNKRIIFLSLVLAITALPSQAQAANKPGGPCQKSGAATSFAKVKYLCLLTKSSLSWQIANPENSHRLNLEKAITLQNLPDSLGKTLLTAREDKSPWLDQECAVDFPSTEVPLCQGGDLSASKQIVLYGDSHASMWMSAIEKIAKKRGYKVTIFAKLACPIVRVPIWSFQLNKPFTECTQWQDKVISQIQSLKPEVIITTDQWKPAVIDGKRSDYETQFLWQREYPLALKELSAATNKLIVIGNNPSLTQDPITCISKPRSTLPLCASGRTQADNASINRVERDAALALKATFIDTVRWACTESLCPVVIAGKIAYFDQWHFSESYVQYLLPLLEKALALPAGSPN